jgi:hypothetical protein
MVVDLNDKENLTGRGIKISIALHRVCCQKRNSRKQQIIPNERDKNKIR